MALFRSNLKPQICLSLKNALRDLPNLLGFAIFFSGIRIQSISQNLLVKRCEREQPLKQMAISCRWPMSRLEWSRTTKLASLKIQIIAVDFVVGSAITTRIEPPYLTVLKCSIRATRKGRKLVVIRFMAATHGLNGTAKHR